MDLPARQASKPGLTNPYGGPSKRSGVACGVELAQRFARDAWHRAGAAAIVVAGRAFPFQPGEAARASVSAVDEEHWRRHCRNRMSAMATPDHHRSMLTVLVITQEDPFYIPHFFRTFCRMHGDHANRITIKEVVIQPSFGESKLQLARRMLEFYGWADFLRLLGRYASQKAQLLSERLQIREAPTSIAGICRQHQIAVRVEADVNRPDFVDWIREAGIDLIVSVSAPQIFKQPLLQAPRYGCINIHNGRLPDYRGMLPNFWQMLNREAHSTTTIHTMVAKLDAGGIVWEEKTPIQPGMKLDTLIRQTKEKSAEALWRVLEDLAQTQKLTIIREIAGKGSYYSFPTQRDAKRLRAAGHSLL
jgi:methionyl-tRNA formyltransferase